jgi:uncharacterized protein (DUF362 family)
MNKGLSGKNMSKKNRREFITGMSSIGMAAMLWPDALISADTETPIVPELVHVKGKDPAENVRQAMEALGGMKKFVGKDDIVTIKPNISWDRTPELGATTDPGVMKEIVKLCFDAGAKKVTVIDHTCNEARRCYTRSGVAEAVRAVGGTVEFTDNRRLVEMDIGGELVKKWKVFRDFVETDKLINVPVAKHHGLTKVSMAMKSWFGVIGGKRSHLHQEIDQVLVDLTRFFKADLTILDAYRVLMRNGPQGGNIADVEKRYSLVAGTDQVFIDTYGAEKFHGLPRRSLPFLDLAKEQGIGAVKMDKKKIKKIKL